MADVDPSINDRSGARFEAMMRSLDPAFVSAANAVLSPWHDNIASSHARYVAELDAACRRAGL